MGFRARGVWGLGFEGFGILWLRVSCAETCVASLRNGRQLPQVVLVSRSMQPISLEYGLGFKKIYDFGGLGSNTI